MSDKKTQVISVLNLKGGAGKSTVTMNLGVAFKKLGLSVLLVDSDPQGSLRDWSKERNSQEKALEGGSLLVVGLDRPTIAKDIESLKGSYDIIIIDGTQRGDVALATGTIKAADLVIIPVLPSPLDVNATAEITEILKSRQEITDGKPKGFYLVNRFKSGTKLSASIISALNGYDMQTFDGKLRNLEVYAQTASYGGTVFDNNIAISAIDEVKNLTYEILNHLKVNYVKS